MENSSILDLILLFPNLVKAIRFTHDLLECFSLLVVMQTLRCRLPPGRLPWLDLRSVQFIDFFQTEAFDFWDEEIDVEVPEDQHAEEDQENQRPDALRECLFSVLQQHREMYDLTYSAAIRGAKNESRKFHIQSSRHLFQYGVNVKR